MIEGFKNAIAAERKKGASDARIARGQGDKPWIGDGAVAPTEAAPVSLARDFFLSDA